MNWRITVAVWTLLGVCSVAPGVGGETEEITSVRFKKLSIEELVNYQITSVSKSEESASEAPAAVYVITEEDIRRSGANSIPEALRMVPGLQVARISSDSWAISARGFNEFFANKLLVLMDGRSLYTPLFAGVFWDVQDTVLEDIDRIELIRGPGATLWGANAVNGVINILTKPAKETQGWLLSGAADSQQSGQGAVRYGGKLSENAFYRVYVKYNHLEPFPIMGDSSEGEPLRMGRTGFRLDWETSPSDLLVLQGDLYWGEERLQHNLARTTPPFTVRRQHRAELQGANLIGRWTHWFSDGSELQTQLYYDRTYRDEPTLRETRDTIDFETQHRILLGERNVFLWGVGYRALMDETQRTSTFELDPLDRTVDLWSAFAQDEITLWPDRLKLTVGSKLEHNDYTGWELQPGARLAWTPHPQHTVWSSVARAVRTPSRTEEDISLTQPGPFPGSVVHVQGSADSVSEELLAYEIGYRVQPRPNWSLDWALFYNDYDHLRTLEPQRIQTGPPTVIPFVIGNNLEGRTYGLEFASSWQLFERWRLQAGYSYLEMDLDLKSGSLDPTAYRAEGLDPEQQFFLRSLLDLPHNLELDCALRFVDRLPAADIPSYIGLDVRLGWRPTKNLELSVGGRDLLDDRHPEFAASYLVGTAQREVPRLFYGKVTWRF